MEKTLKVFLDDERKTPEGWYRTFTVEETIALLETGTVDAVSLDNDLGTGYEEGYKVADWLEEQIITNPEFSPPNFIRIHTQNVKARERMKAACRNIRRYAPGIQFFVATSEYV